MRQAGQLHLEDILKGQTLEERVYRLRCVEAWSMVIPWVGFPLSDFIKKVEPTSKAKFVEFYTLDDPGQMPGVRQPVLRWPYLEGLRMDEAMHPLAILGRRPLRRGDAEAGRRADPADRALEVRLQERQVDRPDPLRREAAAQHLAGDAASSEYGFYSNVNPTVDHPRWTQATERRIGEFFRRKTLMFNGYGDQVASLYAGMDLKRNY